jgi:hypothetical protein
MIVIPALPGAGDDQEGWQEAVTVGSKESNVSSIVALNGRNTSGRKTKFGSRSPRREMQHVDSGPSAIA